MIERSAALLSSGLRGGRLGRDREHSQFASLAAIATRACPGGSAARACQSRTLTHRGS